MPADTPDTAPAENPGDRGPDVATPDAATPDAVPQHPAVHVAPGALTHLDATGAARMVDVADKPVTHRVAVAGAFIAMAPSTLEMIVTGSAPKGDVLATARIAGIMAAKRTAELIPMCHPLNITHAAVELVPERSAVPAPSTGPALNARTGIRITATVEVDGKTGIEMEALTAASVAALTVYDMCKAVDRGMVISDVCLLLKEGGKSGLWTREENT